MGQIRYFNTLRLLAAFSVVLLHSSATYFYSGIYSEKDYFPFGFYYTFNVFAVPVFLMISGALFLRSDKELNYPILLKKYVRRIAAALLLFGLPMCFIDSIFNNEPLCTGLVNFLRGHSWDHIWYLYMLISLYLLTPICKEFTNHASRQTIRITLIVLFVMSSILPTLKYFGVKLENWMTLSPYLLIYMLGYYLTFMDNDRIKILHLILTIIVCVILTFFKLTIDIKEVLYFEPTGIILSIAIFLLFKKVNITCTIADQLNPYCFGIYLIHPVFTNTINRILHFNPANYFNAWISIPLLAIVIFISSLACCYILRKIPFLRNHVL